jgi:hypothetical protein
LASNLGAFNFRHGAIAAQDGYKLLGEFSGNLANGGEDIHLVDKASATITLFSYDDGEPWPAEADGSGMVLSLSNPLGNPDPNNAGSWSAKEPFGGIEVPPIAGDLDGDLIPDAIEVAMGTDPADPLSFAFPSASVETLEVAGAAAAYATFTYQVDTQVGAALPVETSSDLTAWQDASGQLVELSREKGDGTIDIVTLRTRLPLSETTVQYYRISLDAE